MMDQSLKPLYLLDPDLAETIRKRLHALPDPPPAKDLALLVEEILWGTSQEISLGKTLALGYARLMTRPGSPILRQYRECTRKALDQSGPTYAKILATALVPVLLQEDPSLLERFFQVVQTICTKGIYALTAPLEALCQMLETEDISGAIHFLTLLETVFSQKMVYNECKQLAGYLGKACRQIPRSRRAWTLAAITRIAAEDALLVEPFMDSLKQELGWLDPDGVDRFVDIALERCHRNPELGRKFIALDARSAKDICLDLQRIVPLQQVRHRLNRYIQAATGCLLTVHPLSDLPGGNRNSVSFGLSVASDGRHLFLPDQIEIGDKAANLELYKILARLEAGYTEFETFAFDIQKWLDRTSCPVKGLPNTDNSRIRQMIEAGQTDLSCLFQLFPHPQTAENLFTVFEQARIWHRLAHTSPGVTKRAQPFLRQAVLEQQESASPQELFFLRLQLTLTGIPFPAYPNPDPSLIQKMALRFQETVPCFAPVEAAADLMVFSYPQAADRLRSFPETGDPNIRFPFDRRIRHDLHAATFGKQQEKARRVQRILEQQGIRSYRSDIREKINPETGMLRPEEIRNLARRTDGDHPDADTVTTAIIQTLQKQQLVEQTDFRDPLQPADTDCAIFRYPEWDANQADYLQDHVLVREMPQAAVPGDFYQQTLSAHRGLARQIRRSFEFLKPQQLLILRHWIEGDAFDYRALLDHAIEKKIGVTPSERVYTKRMKQLRDVALLVLVDLSRSTANAASGTEKSVLDIEKQAIVLLCEALFVLGDSFAIAGFSGTGRLGVDYYRIKDFSENLSKAVRHRIHAMRPLRGTRMGAAIRHAANRLEQVEAKVRLLLILSDGFPNDNGYKQDYAIEDTRKALLESRSKNLFAHSITVNMQQDQRLDQLYGARNHNVISDVGELPDRLLRIYSRLTRQ